MNSIKSLNPTQILRKVIPLILMLFCTSILMAQTSVKPEILPPAIEKLSDNVAAKTSATTVFELIQRKEISSVTLTTDLKYLIKNKKKDEYQSAIFNYEGSDGKNYTKKVKIKSRGKSRRRICDFPPLKLKFKKEDLEKDGLEVEFNKLKLVTHCSNTTQSQQNILKEFLAYQLHNEVTDRSFRVQLIKIKYIDSENKIAPVEKYGFILENNDELAERIGGQDVERFNCPIDELDRDEFRLQSVFQYMIGNTDWRIDLMHNVKIIQDGTEGTPVVVPYDFDFSGIVSASYASPHPDYRDTIFSVRDRLYMGVCSTPDEINRTLQVFKDKKEKILNMVDSFEYISKKDRKSISRFMDDFFDEIENKKEVNRIFKVGCEDPVAE